MFVSRLHLKDFRLFADQLFEFNQQLTVLYGPNAAGKSSVVEALALLSSGKSFRAGKVEEMIAFQADLARVSLKANSSLATIKASPAETDLAGLDELSLSILLTRGVVNGKRTHRQLYNVNDNRRRKKDFVGQLLTVVFRPEDMRLIEGSPGRRRDFLNTPLQLTSRNYGHHLSQYEKALRRRNKLLSLIKDGEQSASVLTYWDLSLIKHGEKIQQHRRDLTEFINAQVESPLPMRITYRPSLISQSALDSHKRAAIATGFTLIGPHKDDFLILIDVSAKGGVADGRATSQIQSTNFQSLDAFGSRGQKRLGVLWLKKAELMYLKQQTQQQPVLLLDDILSELDKENRQRVLELIKEEQTIITTAYPALIKEVRAKFTKVDVQDLTALIA